MIQIRHLVINLFFTSLILIGCKSHEKDTLLGENTTCNVLNILNVDIRLDQFPIMKKDAVILDEALDQDIEAPHSCHGGICSSCIARVTEGTAVMSQNQILTDAEVAEGLIIIKIVTR
ncbi:2Fe-2S iron-sulfur cluster protein [Dokdonia sp. Hel_I_63]|jgi:ferredoxin|nr:2Fe-2S iron-sulfur cluster protein [Dokdonia sp. Hel_I_63]